MFNKFRIIIVVLLLSGLSAIAQNKEVPFTQDDRDRLIRLDVKYEMLEKRFDDMNKRFDDMNKRIDDIKTFLYWGFGILFGMMMFLFGFILWERRTALAPVIKENKAIKEVLVKLAETNPDLKKALKYAAIL